MQKTQRWFWLFLILTPLSCGEKPQNPRDNATNLAASNLSSDIARFAGQFAADSAKTRLVILLSPT